MKYLYYRLWQLFKSIKTNDKPASNAIILISTCQIANILTVLFFVRYIFDIEIIRISKSNVYFYTVPIALIAFIFNFFMFYKRRNLLAEKYKNETKNQKSIGVLLLVLYVFASYFLVLFCGVKFA